MSASAARCLVCRNCGTEAPLRAQHACYECFGPLEVGYDAAQLAGVTRAAIEAGPPNMWRYADLLPVGQDPATRVSLTRDSPHWYRRTPSRTRSASGLRCG